MTTLIRITKVLDTIFIVDTVLIHTIYEEGSVDLGGIKGVNNLPVPFVGTFFKRDSKTGVLASLGATGKLSSECWLSTSVGEAGRGL